jgi:hypothetical protein
MECVSIALEDGTVLEFASLADARAGILSNTALPASVRSAIETALTEPRTPSALPPPPLNVSAGSVLTSVSIEEVGGLKVVFAFSEPVSEVNAVAAWLGDALAAASSGACGWWRLVWHASDDKLLLTVGAWFRTRMSVSYSPEKAAGQMRALPFPPDLATPASIRVTIASKPVFEPLVTQAVAAEGAPAAALTRIIGRFERRVNVDRCELFSVDSHVHSYAFLFRVAMRETAPGSLLGALVGWVREAVPHWRWCIWSAGRGETYDDFKLTIAQAPPLSTDVTNPLCRSAAKEHKAMKVGVLMDALNTASFPAALQCAAAIGISAIF